MIKRILRTIECENGEIRCIVSGQRFLLARCRVTLEITENRTQVPSLGVQGGSIKSYRFTVVICSDADYTRKIDEDFLRTVDCYEVSADVFRRDGVYEVTTFSGLQPDEMEIDGEWRFEINHPDTAKKLLTI